MAIDHNDIYSIVERLAILEGRITPTSVKKGLNPQQKSVPQLPALFKPKDISPVLGAKEKKHPMAGYMVGDEKQNNRKPVEEAVATEDVLEKVKKSFADYLSDMADEIKKDTDLKDKKKEDSDLKDKKKEDRDLINKVKKEIDEDPTQDDETAEAPPAPVLNPVQAESYPIKTVSNKCGLWEIHGNENSGFSIKRGSRLIPSRFQSLDEAEMALEMFVSRHQEKKQSADYIDEA